MAAEKNASPMGSIWVLRNVEETPVAAAPRRRLSMGSIKTQQIGPPSKPHEAFVPKNEIVNSPPRRSTRSNNISSQSKDHGSRPSGERVVDTSSEGTGTRNKLKDLGKRPIEDDAPDLTTKKRKSILYQRKPQHKPQDCVYFVEEANRVGASINVFFKDDVISNIKDNLTDAQRQIFSSNLSSSISSADTSIPDTKSCVLGFNFDKAASENRAAYMVSD